jgi:hypothetical protein
MSREWPLSTRAPINSPENPNRAVRPCMGFKNETFFWKADSLFRLRCGALATCRMFGPHLRGRNSNTGDFLDPENCKNVSYETNRRLAARESLRN